MHITRIVGIVFTGAGTTMAATERFARACELPCEVFDITPATAELPEIEPGDLVVFAAPSYGGRVPAPAAQRFEACRGDAAPAVLLVTYGNRAVDDTFIELADIVRPGGFIPVAGLAVVAHHSLMTNVAQGRPDGTDFALIERVAHETLAKLSAASSVHEAEITEVPGNRPYREFSGVPFYAHADADRCVSCGACAAQCPTGAIDPERPSATDSDRCISCARCIAACPVAARDFSGGLALGAARKAFALKCAAHQESYAL